MKVIHVIPSTRIDASGPTHSVTSLVRALAKTQNDISLASVDIKDNEISKNPESFEKIFPLGFGPKKLGRSPALYNWLKKEAFDNNTIFHNHGMWQLNALYCSRVLSESKAKYIQSPRNALSPYYLNEISLSKSFFWSIFQRKALQNVDCFHATCEAEFAAIRNAGFKQPIAIIPNGVEVPEIVNNKRVYENNIMTYLARLHPEKGIEEMMKAWQLVQDRFPRWKLQIYGPGSKKYINRLLLLAEELKLKNIHFLGPVYGDFKYKAYMLSDVYILPSPSENFGMTIAEALICGTPVISTKGSPWQGLAFNNAGWWVDFNIPSIAKAMQDSMSLSSEKRNIMGKRGREWVKKDFSIDKVSSDYLILYRWLLGEADKIPEFVRFT